MNKYMCTDMYTHIHNYLCTIYTPNFSVFKALYQVQPCHAQSFKEPCSMLLLFRWIPPVVCPILLRRSDGSKTSGHRKPHHINTGVLSWGWRSRWCAGALPRAGYWRASGHVSGSRSARDCAFVVQDYGIEVSQTWETERSTCDMMSWDIRG